MPRLGFVLIAALALTWCGGSTPFVKSADPSVRPVLIPSGYVNDQQIELLWARDRKELLNCADKVEALSARKPT